MQRVKHADRKQETRMKIMIGEAAMRAGAFAMPVDEIEAVLAHYVETGGSKELSAFIKRYHGSGLTASDEGGSEASRRDDVKVEALDRATSILQ